MTTMDQMFTPGARLWPSYWRDTGCDLNPSCLACPLPVCRHDDPHVAKLYSNYWVIVDSPSLAEGALRLGVSKQAARRCVAEFHALQQEAEGP